MHGTPDHPSPLGGTTDTVPVVSSVERLFYSADEAAVALSLSKKEIYRLIDAGSLEVAEYGRRLLIVPASLRAFADQLIADTAERRRASREAIPA